jgi:hypothetical protein
LSFVRACGSACDQAPDGGHPAGDGQEAQVGACQYDAGLNSWYYGNVYTSLGRCLSFFIQYNRDVSWRLSDQEAELDPYQFVGDYIVARAYWHWVCTLGNCGGVQQTELVQSTLPWIDGVMEWDSHLQSKTPDWNNRPAGTYAICGYAAGYVAHDNFGIWEYTDLIRTPEICDI